MDVPREQTKSYGILDIDSSSKPEDRLVKAKALVEKPAPEVAPSTLSIIGRYILQPQIFDVLGHQKAGAGGEIQLTDAINSTAGVIPTHGFRFEGTRYDCGSVPGYVAANVAFALQDDSLRAPLTTQIQQLLKGLA